MQVVGHGNYSITVNCCDKATQIFRPVFEILSDISEILFMYAKISRGNPSDGLRNPDLGTLAYIESSSYAPSILT
jgi:hypothetical protein